MNAVWDWIKSHGPVHVVIVAFFAVPTIWLLSIVPHRQAPVASKARLWFDSLEDQTVDLRVYYGRKATADPQIVLLSIDSASTRGLDQLDDATIRASPALTDIKGGYPFPREVYALACDRLFAAGAKVVAFDLIFQTPSPTDAIFRQALERYHDQVVIPLRFNDDSTSVDVPPQSLIPSGDPFDDRLAYPNYWEDSDGVVRDVRYRTNLEFLAGKPGADQRPKLCSFAARVVQRAGHPELVPSSFASRPLRFTRCAYPGPPAFPSYSFYQVFDPSAWDQNFDHGNFFRDKIVVIGPDGGLFHDVHPIPNGVLPGVQIHLNAINALLHGEFLTPATNQASMGIVGLAAVFALLLALFFPSIGFRYAAALALAAGYAGVVMAAYNGAGLLLPVMAPTLVFSGAVSVGFVYDFIVSQLERYRLRITFERYNSKKVVKYLLAHPDSYRQMLTGTHRDISVLFSDIRSFTTIVETAPDPRELVRKLNEYLTAMVDCVIKQDGNLEKFMGDGIMAVWGNTPYSNGAKDDAIRATRAALAMTVELRRLNAKWVAEGRDEWRIGIGVNHGNVIVGDMGSPEHKEFAMVGDPVNLGSRLEGLTKEYHVQIMIGELAANLIEDVFYLRSVDLVKVKGKTRAVKAYTVLGERKDGLAPDEEKFLQLHEEAMAAFRRRDFERARELFELALRIKADDFIAGEFRKSAAHYARNPPPPDWDGVRVMKEK